MKARAGDGDELAGQTLSKITESWKGLKKAIDEKKAIHRTCKEKKEESEAALENAVEESIPAGANKARILSKLENVEGRWQEFKEVKAEGLELKRQAKEDLKLWQEKLDRAIGEADQPELPGLE